MQCGCRLQSGHILPCNVAPAIGTHLSMQCGCRLQSGHIWPCNVAVACNRGTFGHAMWLSLAIGTPLPDRGMKGNKRETSNFTCAVGGTLRDAVKESSAQPPPPSDCGWDPPHKAIGEVMGTSLNPSLRKSFRKLSREPTPRPTDRLRRGSCKAFLKEPLKDSCQGSPHHFLKGAHSQTARPTA